MPQSACFIDGRSVSRAEAVRAAAALIAASRLPVLLVGACDVAASRAVIKCADRAGGVIDHVASETAFRELDVMRGFGKFIVTPNEAHQRADTVLLVGAGLTKLWPDMVERLGLGGPPRLALRPERRRVFCLGSGNDASLLGFADQALEARDEALPGLIAALRACLGHRRVAVSGSERTALVALAEKLAAAQYGLVVYTPLGLDALAIEMLMGLVVDLNKTTRFSTLSVSGSGNSETLMQTAGWMTGFPVRTGFGRGFPEHDPWRFDAARLIQANEADVLVWVASANAEFPAWASRPPLVALTAAGWGVAQAKVEITVGTHGRDHDTIEFVREVQSLAWREATGPSDVPSAAAVLDEITASLSREAA
jgi:formylmethanofuran dehydrogenase subunit B